MWFHRLPVAKACYSVTKGVDCEAARYTLLAPYVPLLPACGCCCLCAVRFACYLPL